MTSLVLKKRKFNEPVTQFSEMMKPKMTISANGKLQKSYDTYFKNLAIMFPTLTRQEIHEEYQNSNDDFLLTIERLKTKQAMTPKFQNNWNKNQHQEQLQIQREWTQNSEQNNKQAFVFSNSQGGKKWEQSILTTLNRLVTCSNQNEAVSVLEEFGMGVEKEGLVELDKREAENIIIKKAFKTQRKIMAEIIAKETQDKLKIEGLERQVSMLIMTIRQQELEKRRQEHHFNDDVY